MYIRGGRRQQLAHLYPGDAPAVQDPGQSAHGGFDFWKLGHVLKVGV